jgi:hypothetical protein
MLKFPYVIAFALALVACAEPDDDTEIVETVDERGEPLQCNQVQCWYPSPAPSGPYNPPAPPVPKPLQPEP